MSVISIANTIPSDINTLERLIAWGGLTLAYINPTIAILETENSNQKAAQSTIFQAADNSYRLLIRASLPIDQSFVNDRNVKVWMKTLELSNTQIPADFQVN